MNNIIQWKRWTTYSEILRPKVLIFKNSIKDGFKTKNLKNTNKLQMGSKETIEEHTVWKRWTTYSEIQRPKLFIFKISINQPETSRLNTQKAQPQPTPQESRWIERDENIVLRVKSRKKNWECTEREPYRERKWHECPLDHACGVVRA